MPIPNPNVVDIKVSAKLVLLFGGTESGNGFRRKMEPEGVSGLTMKMRGGRKVVLREPDSQLTF